ncbi:peptidyl-Asp metalloendopeptidase [Rhizobium subbaraonis]|uniref:Peptidyl-Asp metalloendopeptidase n=1 Tax=Rhizobium subbaraonis TaxID=908946 RepID=A0A285V6K7_9HYPH|nr:M12 family metallo-peptidase [Rhizobium subbaraonis]SOC48161.1 peptidyl-Asp metalloendopeptidase [Rhizobium subbaraonis]
MRQYFFMSALLAYAINGSSALSQENAFITLMQTQDLTPQQTEALAQLRQLPSTEDVQVVRVNPSILREQPEVTIPLPDRDSVVVAADTRTSLGEGNFAVAGRTQTVGGLAFGGGPEETSTFAVNGDAVTGSIQTDTGLYRIRPIGGGAHALVKVGAFPPEHPGSFNERRSENRDLPPFAENVDSNVVDLNILVAYTPAVRSKLFDVTGLVSLAFLETNSSYQLSGVHIKAVPATPAPIEVAYTESGSMDDDLANLKSKNDNIMDDLHEMRNTSKADIVVLLVDDDSFCGLASDILGSKESAFAIVYHDCATGYYSFAHEIGHLQGARHNPEADPTSTPFPYGHGYMDSAARRRTIMAYNCPNDCKREPQWARPKEWGTPDLHHDARVLNETRNYVASFR